MPLSLILLVSLLTGLGAQEAVVLDMDQNSYPVVRIGSQWWMAENLRVARFNNGDSIPLVAGAYEWAEATRAACSYYQMQEDNREKYGYLYNWYVATDPRGVCPAGWRVPTDKDWMAMEATLGMDDDALKQMTAWRGNAEGNLLKSPFFGGSNTTGFNARGNGYRHPDGSFKAMGQDIDFWTATAYDNEGREEGILRGLNRSQNSVVRNFHHPAYGFSIRCVRDTHEKP